MSIINTTDNNCGKELKEIIDNKNNKYFETLETTAKNINQVANKKISDLLKSNLIIVYPPSTDDKIEDEEIFSLSSSNKLTTNNIMGFISCNETSINIKSRFPTDGEGKEDYFLHYMLCKVLSINTIDLETHSSKDKALDFLIYLFAGLLNKALSQGVFKKYQKYEYNNSNVKGVIDVNRHIRKNIPFTGKIAYNVREYSSDNYITQLIRHTIEYIKTKDNGRYILSGRETKDNVLKIVLATQHYNKNERAKIINKNLKSLSHPYYYEYIPLQKICMQILRYEKIKIGADKNKIYGLLFDGSWLWEEYLNKVLESSNLKFIHAENKTKKNGIYLFKNNKYIRYPDFYNRDNNKSKIVMDAKYKKVNKTNEADREDLDQIITYMHVLQSTHGVLIYPDKGDNNNSLGTLNGYGGEVYKYVFDVVDNKDIGNLKEYASKMIERENKFIDNLKKIKLIKNK